MSFFKELKEDIAQSVSELSEALEDDLDGRNEEDSTEQSAIEDIVLEEPKAEDDSDPAAGLDTDELADLTAMYGAELQGDAPDTKQTDTDFVNMGIAEFPGTGDIEAKETVFEDILTETVQPEETEGIEEEPYEEELYEYEEPITEQEESKEDFNMNEDFVNNMDMEEQTEGMEEVMEEETSSPAEEITVITQGTIISGSIKSDTSLLVKGTIEGDVECEGKLTIEGRVAGNTIAKEIYVNTPRLEGDINSRGIVKIDVGTVVLGSISCTSVVVAGAVKGDIDVNGPVIIDSTAVVKGNVRAKSIQINSGAVIEGSYSLAYADVDIDRLFEQ
ncbi:MAG: polymer-forming cytoskeletal protein [Eubacterium sp.]|jgi:Integral membrane protein CcmA involved in cell shape determination|nr:polymer-forming cytoskeletal protein [Eubacterium sp.]